ncbi:hypothetical protein [Deinococcus sp. UYEF24]
MRLSLDLNSVVVAETRGQISSLWKIPVSQPQKRVLVYQGAVQSWALDAAPYLLVLKPGGTLLSYDMTRKKQRWSTQIPFPVPGASIDLLSVGELLALTLPDPSFSPLMIRSADGQILSLLPGFELRRTPETDGKMEPLPVTSLHVLEQTSLLPTLAFRLIQTTGGAVQLQGYSYRDPDPCIACGFNK